jgi:tRNA threonylcarbamoyladenosine biosynthesis protein TsaE
MPRHQAIHELPDEGATAALARSLAAMLVPGDVVTLEGQLGAGKTTFVRHLADALGVAHGSVSSPTFVVINQYAIPPREPASAANAAKPVHPLAPGQLIHVDAYRVHDPAELENAGWDHLFDTKGHPIGAAAAIIEWPSRILAAIPEDACRIVLETIGVDSRRVEISISGAWLDDAARAQASRDAARRVLESPPIRCPVTREWVEPTRASYPFASDRARLADLHKWFSGEHAIPREIRPEDDEDMGLG